MSTLTERIDAIQFSDDARELIVALTSSDVFRDGETYAVILIAASELLIRLQPSIVIGGPDTILSEFSELVRFYGRLAGAEHFRPGKPMLRIVESKNA